MPSSTPRWVALFFPEPPGLRLSLGLLAVRFVAGAAFILHGLPKIQNPLGWMGDAMPAPLQAAAALSEFGGGIAWILGLATPLASLGILGTMSVATWTHVSRGDPFVGRGGAFEPALLYAAIALMLFLGGPGKLSADEMVFRKQR